MKIKVFIENLSVTEKETLYGGFSDCIGYEEETLSFATNPTCSDRMCYNVNCLKVCTNNKECSNEDTLSRQLTKKEKGEKRKYRKHKTNETSCKVNWICVDR